VAKYETPSGNGSPRLRGDGASGLGPNGRREPVLGDTLPPQPLKELLSAGGANLYVLSADAELADTVQRASGEQYPVFVVDDWRELLTAVETGHCGIALLDAEFVGADLIARITALETHADRLVLLVAADRAGAQELMGLLSDRRIHRLLIKPATLGITRLLVESAVNRCLQLRELASTPPADLAVRAFRRSSLPRRVLGFAVVLLVLGGAVVAGLRLWPLAAHDASGAPHATAVAPAAVPAEAAKADVESATDRFTELLHRAAEALNAGRLAAPTGDNALDYYLTVLAADPDEPTANAQLANVVDALFAQAESALLADAPDAAAAALAGVRRADPTSSRLAFLEAQLERAKAARVAAQAAKAASAAREPVAEAPVQRAAAGPRSELDSLLVIATARLQRGQLLEPRGDSAVEYLNRAAEIDATNERVARVRSTLTAALLEAARTALSSADLDQATKLANAAHKLGADPEALAVLDVELVGAQNAVVERRHSNWLASAQARLRDGALTAPPGDNALEYLRRLQDEQPNFAGLAAAWDRWTGAVAAKVRQAADARDWATAEATLVNLEQSPRGAAVAAPLRDQIQTARQQERYLATAVPASELNLVEAPPATYPAEALRRNIEGWVDLEFVVDRTGRPRELKVLAADPMGRFEEAALAVVGTYRYMPFEEGGHVYERRVRLRIRFALN
jgi:TonB family protein